MRTGRGGAGAGSGPHREQNVQNQDQISGEQDAIDPDEAAVARTFRRSRQTGSASTS